MIHLILNSVLDVLRYANQLSSKAHMHVMRTMKPGMKEYQAEATFLHYVYFHGGARHAGYNPIAAGGKSGIFLYPTGAQGVTLSVCLSVRTKCSFFLVLAHILNSCESDP